MKVFINLEPGNALCAQADPEVWGHRSTHEQARKICWDCPEQVDCYLTGLVERRYGTWGGAWFPEEVLKELSSRAALYMRTGVGNPKLGRVIDQVIDELCRRLEITRERFHAQHGHGEVAIYRAVTGIRPRYREPAHNGLGRTMPAV